MAMVCEPWIVYCSHQVSASSDNWVLIAGASVWIFEIERILKLSSPDIHSFSLATHQLVPITNCFFGKWAVDPPVSTMY